MQSSDNLKCDFVPEPPEEKEGYFLATKKSFVRVWLNKFLWLWGIVLPSGVYLYSYNYYPTGEMDLANPEVNQLAERIRQFFSANPDKAFLWLSIILALFLLLWVFSAISRAGVIRTLDELQNNIKRKEFSVRYVFRYGKIGTLRILKLDLFIFLSLVSILVILLLPLAFISRDANPMSLAFIGFLAFVIYTPLLFLGVFLRNIGAIHISLARQSPISCLEVGYMQLLKNIREAVKLFLLTLALEIMKMVFMIAVAYLSLLILILVAVVSGVINPNLQLVSNFFVRVLILLLIISGLLWVKAIFSLWVQDLWVWWAKKFGAVKIEEPVKETGKVMVEKVEPVAGG